MQKKDIAEIHPLTFMQQALLMHNQSEEEDQGLIQVTANIKGVLNTDTFIASWQHVVDRHAALRASIHWKNLSKPVQVVQKQVQVQSSYADISALEADERKEKLAHEVILDRNTTIDLSKVPLFRISIYKLSKSDYFLLWTCHHILLDGWSSSIVLSQVIEQYGTLVEAKGLENLEKEETTSFYTYLNSINKIDKTGAEKFWKSKLQGLKDSSVVDGNTSEKHTKSSFSQEEVKLSVELSDKLRKLASTSRVGLNTVFQGFWSLILARLLDSKDVVFGFTTSGRSRTEFDDADQIVGILTNVLPLRIILEDSLGLTDFLKTIQREQSAVTDYEYMSLNEILYLKDWSSNISMFDSLFVFENLPDTTFKAGGIEVCDYESGLTSTYPLALTVKPAEAIEVILKYDENKTSKPTIKSILKLLDSLFTHVTDCQQATIGDFLTTGPSFLSELKPKKAENISNEHTTTFHEKLLLFNRKFEGSNKSMLARRSTDRDDYVPPGNSMELAISQIWEDLFNWYPVGIKDNFFEIGGTSMMAVQLFSEIQKYFGVNIPPTILLANSTVKDLSDLIRNEGKKESWAAIVALREKGNKKPLFCLHAGGAHVLFYNDLAKHMDSDQPVYAIQPVGLDGMKKAHESIEEMASYYIQEIRKVQPIGPYALLGTCFSDAVALEIADQLAGVGQRVEPLIVVDSQPIGIKLKRRSIKERLRGYKDLIHAGKFDMVYEGFKKNMDMIFSKNKQLEKEEFDDVDYHQLSNLELMRKNLVDLYENYQWKPYDGRITFIQSQGFNERPWMNSVVETWKERITEDVVTHVVPGNHFTLFEEPDVKGLAEKIKDLMEQNTTTLAEPQENKA